MAGHRSTGFRRGLTVVMAVVATAGAAVGASAEEVPADRSEWGAVTSRASVTSGGHQANGGSFGLAISRSGRFVAFDSEASNLVAGDTNGSQDVFVRDRLAGVTQRVSVGPRGRQANRFCWFPEISDNGRYVVFSSRASNLVAGDTNSTFDIFMRDTVAGVTSRVSVGPGGRQGNGASLNKAISADGRVVAFGSEASNLIRGDTNRAGDVFVRDQQAGVTRRVSVGRGGREANGASFDVAMSANGRYVTFISDASNLVRGDTNRTLDVFVRDRQAKVTQRVSTGRGRQANGVSFGPAISNNGRYVAFMSEASNLVRGDTNDTFDVFVHDRLTGLTRRMSVGPGGRQADGFSEFPAISGNGRRVVFHSAASNLVPGDTNQALDVFVRDRLAGVTRRVSVRTGSGQADSDSFTPEISADGRHIAFASVSTTLVPRDTNGHTDIFVRERLGDAARLE